MVQWLGLCASTAKGAGLAPGGETKIPRNPSQLCGKKRGKKITESLRKCQARGLLILSSLLISFGVTVQQCLGMLWVKSCPAPTLPQVHATKTQERKPQLRNLKTHCPILFNTLPLIPKTHKIPWGTLNGERGGRRQKTNNAARGS